MSVSAMGFSLVPVASPARRQIITRPGYVVRSSQRTPSGAIPEAVTLHAEDKAIALLKLTPIARDGTVDVQNHRHVVESEAGARPFPAVRVGRDRRPAGCAELRGG